MEKHAEGGGHCWNSSFSDANLAVVAGSWKVRKGEKTLRLGVCFLRDVDMIVSWSNWSAKKYWKRD